MKTKLLRSLLSLWAALLLSSALFLLPASAEGETITFSLRIEGITANVFYKTVTVPSDGTPTARGRSYPASPTAWFPVSPR